MERGDQWKQVRELFVSGVAGYCFGVAVPAGK